MSWPLSHEFNESIQNPRIVFNDPELKAGNTVVGATGLPLPRSGNFADVYQLKGADGRDWAVKCFTRPVTGLAERYAMVSEALDQANLPFTIGFSFLAEGILVGDVWRPIVKMEWVEGLLLNHVVRENAGRPQILTALSQMWVKLCKRLRDAGIAHADLQHGNVLLVPGSRQGAYGLKLIDYDGMYVPALANKPSGEVGHPSYQHPLRAKTRAYSPDVDRFPHLVVATALKGLSVAGQPLWDRYDNGDNLLFTEADYQKPSESKAMRELWQTENPSVQALVGRLAIACGKPIPQTPWLDQFAPDGEPELLSNEQRQDAANALGIALPVPASYALDPVVAQVEEPVVAQVEEPAPRPDLNEFANLDRPSAPSGKKSKPHAALDLDSAEIKRPARRKVREEEKEEPANNTRMLLILGGIGGAFLLVCGIVAGVLIINWKKTDVVQTPEKPTTPIDPPKDPGTPLVPTPGPKPKDPEPGPGPGPGPVPGPDPGPGPAPKPKDPEPPMIPVKAGNPQAMKLRWTASPEGKTSLFSLYVREANNLVLVGSAGTDFLAYDLKTGNKRSGFAEVEACGTPHFFSLDDDKRVAVSGVRTVNHFRVWDEKTGQELNKILVPNIPAVTDAPGAPRLYLSPNAQFAVITKYQIPTKTDDVPLRIVDLTKQKVVTATDWTSGEVFFTADSSRVLIAEAGGRCRWFKLPSGALGDTFTLPSQSANRYHSITSISGDGSVLGYRGPTGRGMTEFGPAVLDGTTGKPITLFPREYYPSSFVSVSADGKRAAVQRGIIVNDLMSYDVIEVRTGAILGRASLTMDRSSLPRFALSQSGTVLVVAANTLKKVYAFDLDSSDVAIKPEPPLAGPELKVRWSVDVKIETGTNTKPLFDSEGQTIFLATSASPSTCGAFNARTGASLGELNDVSASFVRVIPMEKGKLGYQNSDKELRVWDSVAGKVERLGYQPKLPSEEQLVANMSPNGKFVTVGSFRANTTPKLRALSVDKGGLLFSRDGPLGTTAFTSDSSRLLIVDGTGHFRWYNLSPVKIDEDWKFDRAAGATESRVSGLSSDGSVIFYYSKQPAKEPAYFLLDGKKGTVIHPFTAGQYLPVGDSLSEDGRFVTLVRSADKSNDRFAIDVCDNRGALVGTINLPPKCDVVASSWKAGIAVVYDHRNKKLMAFDLPALPTP
jgi:hypothetical protein